MDPPPPHGHFELAFGYCDNQYARTEVGLTSSFFFRWRARVLSGFGKLNLMPAPPGTMLYSGSTVVDRVVDWVLQRALRLQKVMRVA